MSETHQWAVQIGGAPPGEPNYLLIAGIGVTAVAIGAIMLGGKKKK